MNEEACLLAVRSFLAVERGREDVARLVLELGTVQVIELLLDY